MKPFKKSVIFSLIFVLSVLSGCKNNSTPDFTGSFRFTVLKAGKADAIIMQTQNHSIILDMGEKDDGDEISEYLEKNSISDIDYVFITHFDKDHIGGFPEVADAVGIKSILVPDYEANNKAYSEFVDTVIGKNLTVTRLTEDKTIVLDDVIFEISVPKKHDYEESDNDYSLVISVTDGENTFLFAGDAEKDRLYEVLSEISGQFDFLKVPHHGKFNENTEKFINAVKPQYAVITDSAKNPASDKTVSLLKAQKTEIYSTKNGDISVISDGKKIKINQ